MTTIKKKVSIVFRIMDAITGKPVNKNLVKLYVNGVTVDTIHKNDGYTVVCNLPDDTYDFDIVSDVYQSDRITVNTSDIDPLNPVLPVTLNPGMLYPGSSNLVLVHGKLDSSKKPFDQTDVLLVYSRNLEKIKIAQESVKKGSTRVKLYTTGKKDLAGRMFLIKDKDDVNSELCRIISGPYDNDIYAFEHQLSYTHKRGEMLKSAVKAYIDGNGAFHARIHDIDKDDREALIIIRVSGKVLHSESITLELGTDNNTGIIKF